MFKKKEQMTTKETRLAAADAAYKAFREHVEACAGCVYDEDRREFEFVLSNRAALDQRLGR
jgi:hypothetical protein